MITNTELEQILELEKKASKAPWRLEELEDLQFSIEPNVLWIGPICDIKPSDLDLLMLSRNKIAQMAREIIRLRRVEDSYKDLCAPQEKTGEVK